MSGSLPDVPALSAAVDGLGRLFVGTDVGVFSTSDDGANWFVENTGFGNIVVNHLVLRGNSLYAFTHGRGTWRVTTVTGPSLAIDDVTATEGNSGTQGFVFTVSLSQAAVGNEAVDFATANGSATAGSDYTATSGTLTFGAGTSSQTLSVSVGGDTLFENDETFSVNLSNPQNAQIADSIGTGTITNNDAAPSLSIGDVTVTEGDSGTQSAVFTVTQSFATGAPTTVQFATSNGTAAAGSDYVATSGSLTIGAGATSQTLSVTVNGDLSYEPNETFTVTLSNPSPAAVTLLDASATGTINDNDTQPRLAISDASATEGNSGTTNAVFDVSLSVASGFATTVHYATADGSALAGSDYTQSTGDLTFSPGVTSRTLAVPVIGETSPETDETFSVVLTSPNNASLLDDTGVGTIVNDDLAANLFFSLSNYTVGEAATYATVGVRRTGNLAPASVQYSIGPGSASAGADFIATTGTLSFAQGVLLQSFKVPLIPDTSHEPGETVMLRLKNPGGYGLLASPSTAVLTIADNDPWPSFSFAAGAMSVKESAGSANLVVKRIGSTLGTSSVDYTTVDGTASAGSDYTLTGGTLTFGPGVVTQTVSVPINDDPDPEARETFTMTLSNPATAVLGLVKTEKVTILDNDQGLSFSAAAYSVLESSPRAVITVRRSGGTAGSLSVNYDVTGGSATGGGTDYSFSSDTLSFGPGVAARTFAVNIVNDGLDEGSEDVQLSLSNAIPSTALKAPTTATLTILDNEAVFRFGLAKYSVVEYAAKATVGVVRTGSTASGAQVDYVITGGTATVGTDYAVTLGTLSFAPGQVSRTLAVAIVNDKLDEVNETALLQLQNGTLPIGTPGAATVTIVDNDTAGKVQFAASNFSVLEGGTATITLKRTLAASSGATVQYAATGGTAGGGEYTLPPGTITFNAGELTKTFTVATAPDGTLDGAKSVVLTLSNPGGGLLLGTPTAATLWILDADGP